MGCRECVPEVDARAASEPGREPAPAPAPEPEPEPEPGGHWEHGHYVEQHPAGTGFDDFDEFLRHETAMANAPLREFLREIAEHAVYFEKDERTYEHFLGDCVFFALLSLIAA